MVIKLAARVIHTLLARFLRSCVRVLAPVIFEQGKHNTDLEYVRRVQRPVARSLLFLQFPPRTRSERRTLHIYSIAHAEHGREHRAGEGSSVRHGFIPVVS